MKRKLYLFLFVLWVASGCIPAGSTPQIMTPPAASPQQEDGTERSGIKGRAMWITLTGVGPERYTDPIPLSETILVTDTRKNVTARVRPDAEGYFRVEVPPGEYYLSIDPASYASRWVGVYAVTVTAGQMQEVEMIIKVPLS